MVDTKQTITASARRFLSGTMLSRVTGFGREVAMASMFGVTPLVAAFWMAFRFANLLRRLLGEGGLSSSFLPYFESVRTKNVEEAARLFRDLLFSLFLFLFLLVVVVEGSLGSYLYFASPSEGTRSVLLFTLLLFPAVIAICLFGLSAALLQYERRFFLTAVAPAILNLVWIAAALLFGSYGGEHALYGLAVVLMGGYFLQWGLMLPGCYRVLLRDMGSTLWSNIRFFSRDLAKISRYLVYTLLGIGATQINSALDVLFARAASSTGPAYLAYALRLYLLPLSLFGVAVATALTPSLIRMIKQGEEGKAQETLLFALKKAASCLVPCCLGTLFLAPSSLELVFGRGAFSAADSVATSHCLNAYVLGLVPAGLSMITVVWFYAWERYTIPMWCSIGGIGANVALNLYFIYGCGWGAASVALATALSMWGQLAALWSFLYRERVAFRGVVKTAVSSALCACIAIGVAGYVENALLGQVMGVEVWRGGESIVRAGLSTQLANFCIPAFPFLAVYGVLSWIFPQTGLRAWLK